MRRQPLQDAATNSLSGSCTTTSSSTSSSKRKSNSKSRASSMTQPLTSVLSSSSGRENEIRRGRAQSLLLGAKTSSKSERWGRGGGVSSKFRARSLLGNMFDSFKRSNSTDSESSSSNSKPSALAAQLSLLDHTEQWGAQSVSLYKQQLPKQQLEFRDVSQTSATTLTDSDTSSPLNEDQVNDIPSFYTTKRTSKGMKQHGWKGRTTTIQKRSKTLPKLTMKQQQQPPTVIAAIKLQAVFRAYRQRYEFRMLLLKRKLQQIEQLKQRQLAKLVQRTKNRKKAEKSMAEFENCKVNRQLQRFTRIIPFLFRDAQAKLAANVQLALQLHQRQRQARRQVDPNCFLLQSLESSHINLRCIAHRYLESMEDLPGIWEALKAQWMGPKKPRVRRIFGPDGKPKKAEPLKQYDSCDEDLPSGCGASRVLQRKDSFPNQRVFADLRRQANQVEASRMTDRDVDRAVEHVNSVLGGTMLN